MGGDSVKMDMLLRELWNDGEVSIPPLQLKLVLFTLFPFYCNLHNFFRTRCSELEFKPCIAQYALGGIVPATWGGCPAVYTCGHNKVCVCVCGGGGGGGGGGGSLTPEGFFWKPPSDDAEGFPKITSFVHTYISETQWYVTYGTSVAAFWASWDEKPWPATERFLNLSINFKVVYCTQHIVHMYLTHSHSHAHPSTHHTHPLCTPRTHTLTPHTHTHTHTHTPGRGLEPVRLTLAQRTGSRKVTLVDNLDGYLIPPAEIAHRIASVSTTGDQWGSQEHMMTSSLQQGAAMTMMSSCALVSIVTWFTSRCFVSLLFRLFPSFHD